MNINFTLSKEQKLAQQLFRDFTSKEIEPLAREIDEYHSFPSDNVKKMQKYGFMGIPYSKDYGGQGCDTLTYVLAVEEISRACATTGVIVSAHTSLAAGAIDSQVAAEQKEEYLRPLNTDKLGAFALTEPDAGTDAGSQKTTAVLDGDEYVLNSSKIFITNAGPAKIYIVFAMTVRIAS